MTADPSTTQARARDELLWFLRQSRARTVRSMRQFAETEIVIPDGPFQGRRFRCDRQPYTRLWFDAVDSGRWNRCVATGPTQSGKTLACFVIPLIYHLFEIGETVICGLPDMDMAIDKWREDILPVIEQSRYRSLMPIRGGGSRGGRVESIPFRNGATLKFMSGGGGDKSRAGFTSRVVVITETDGMDQAGATSRESDKITQLEARTRAYGARKRIYMECTLSTEQGRTWQEYTAGTRSRIVLPCPHCRHDVLPERQHFTGWTEASTQAEARSLGKFACPDCGEPWTTEQRTEANRQGRLVHQGQSVDDAGNLTGEAIATDTLGFRWSAIHNLFLMPADLAADEWRASRSPDEENAEKEMRQFVWCLPVAPSRQDETTLLAEEILLRQSTWPRGLVPPDCTVLTAAIDLGKYLCHWIVVGWKPDATCYVVDYGRIEVPSDSLAVEQALMVSLRQFRDLVKDGWPVSQEFAASPGKKRLTPVHVLVDAGYMTPVVYTFCRESRQPFHPAVGRGATQQRTQSYHHPTSRGATVVHIGQDYHVNRQPVDRIDLVEMDADAWKTWVHQRLSCPLDQPGALRLYKAPPQEHLSLAKHLTAERKTEEFVAGKGVVTRWERIRRQNHWFDALYNACVAGHAAGVRLIREQKVYVPPIRPYGVISRGFSNQRF
ncbi:Phage terminase large subunit (GpA) [Caulifigura coniformis]|uniref:Phage terminase large subunit (GpA) n=1 Tax=Caulifigura coniformis TaxID=2527983 RepID=A0A517SII5_9PLAN|nr:terminase gpA endonuclease subunit [Caulifigura coniformis]QDT55930.1 Phage terminase large subunit (GpA) [Caulifigura coniformis]